MPAPHGWVSWQMDDGLFACSNLQTPNSRQVPSYKLMLAKCYLGWVTENQLLTSPETWSGFCTGKAQGGMGYGPKLRDGEDAELH